MELMMIPTTMNNSLIVQLFGLVFSLVQLLLCLEEAVIDPLPKYWQKYSLAKSYYVVKGADPTWIQSTIEII